MLFIVFSAILLLMLVVTVRASLDRNVFKAGGELMPDLWFQATLADAYFGFVTFYVWVFYKEVTLARRLTWFVLIMALGNIAMSVYVLIQLARTSDNNLLEALLTRRSHRPTYG